MAEIHVQAKKHSGTPVWVWIIAVLLIVGAIAYYLMTRNKTTESTTQPTHTTSYVEMMEVHAKPAFNFQALKAAV